MSDLRNPPTAAQVTGVISDSQHGSRGAALHSDSHLNTEGAHSWHGAHHTAFVQADHDALANPHHANTNDPAAGEKAALAGTSGTPSGTNKYVTNDDPRNTDARTPTAHTMASHSDDGALATKNTVATADIDMISGSQNPGGERQMILPITLRGTAQYLAIDFNDVALVAGQIHQYTIVFTEE